MDHYPNRRTIRWFRAVTITVMRCVQLDCKGEMCATGEALMINPPKYVHFCTLCGSSEFIEGEKFPKFGLGGL